MLFIHSAMKNHETWQASENIHVGTSCHVGHVLKPEKGNNSTLIMNSVLLPIILKLKLIQYLTFICSTLWRENLDWKSSFFLLTFSQLPRSLHSNHHCWWIGRTPVVLYQKQTPSNSDNSSACGCEKQDSHLLLNTYAQSLICNYCASTSCLGLGFFPRLTRSINLKEWNVKTFVVLQEGKNNEKFDSHPREPDALPAYLLVHNGWYYGLDLSTSLLLLALALVEEPAVPLFQVRCHTLIT